MHLRNPSRRSHFIPAVGIGSLFVVLLILVGLTLLTPPSPRPQPYQEPLIPTSDNLLQPTRTPRSQATVLSPRFPLVAQATPQPNTLRWRIGVGVPEFNPLLFQWSANRPGWYLNWTADLHHHAVRTPPPAQFYLEPPTASGLGMSFMPMVRVKNGEIVVPLTTVTRLATENPGHLWLIGNEPDVRWQDNTAPDVYAQLYHQLYTTIKAADPTAQVAIGGISQVTPLRLRYLDRILAHYLATFGETMPVDVWNIHTFILREEADSWGVDIPPGFEDVSQGVLWKVADHDNLRLVENQVRLMRQWMEKRGERQKPLIITEYGILMPAEYGFPPETVAAFMVNSFDLFQSLRDPNLGYSADDDRLVQRWVWFSTRFHLYPTGDLFTPEGTATHLMQTLQNYLAEHAE